MEDISPSDGFSSQHLASALHHPSPMTHQVMQMQARAKAPQPVDFWVPAGVRVVTLTGPNTGGKTASLKALGLAAAMSKAGLFLPLQPAEGRWLLLTSAANCSLVSRKASGHTLQMVLKLCSHVS